MTGFYEYHTTLLEHNEVQMPKLFASLKRFHGPHIAIHFSNHSQLSFNPRPAHHDPIGIYAFPKNYIESGNLKKNSAFSRYDNIFIIKPNQNAKILNLNLNADEAIKLLEMVGIGHYYFEEKVIKTARGKLPGHIFWSALEHWRHDNQKTNNSSWNQLFQKMGYNVLYDSGSGIIHFNEPAQLVFLEPKTYIILDVIKNNQGAVISLLLKEFSDFKIKKESNKYGNVSSYYFENIKDGRYFYVNINKLSNSLEVLVCGKYRNNYQFEGDSSEIIDDIKKGFLQCEIKKGSNLDYSRSPIKDIAKIFGFSLKNGEHKIQRNYKSKSDNYLVTVTIEYHPQQTYAKNSWLILTVQRRSQYGYYGAIGNYHYHSEINDPKGSPKDIINTLMRMVEANAQKDALSQDFDLSYKGRTAIRDLDFLNKRVFRERN